MAPQRRNARGPANGNEVPMTETPYSDEQAELSRQIAKLTYQGWRVESQTDRQVVMVRGHRPNHVLHLILSIVTFGLWLIVWLIVALTVKEKRIVLNVEALTK